MSVQANTGLKIYELTELPYLKVHGRTIGELAPLTLFWTGSAVELNVRGSELWVEVESQYDMYEAWISILINGVPVSRQMLTAGRYWVCVFRGMNADVVKNVRIVKDVQAMSGDPGCSLQIHAVKSDGAFLPVQENPTRSSSLVIALHLVKVRLERKRRKIGFRCGSAPYIIIRL